MISWNFPIEAYFYKIKKNQILPNYKYTISGQYSSHLSTKFQVNTKTLREIIEGKYPVHDFAVCSVLPASGFGPVIFR